MPTIRSPPSRAAWIEMSSHSSSISRTLSPPSRAAWIEIEQPLSGRFFSVSRRLHGRRGLKSEGASSSGTRWKSPPSRAAWIEITGLTGSSIACNCRRLHGRRGLKSPSFTVASNLPACRRLHGRRGLKCMTVFPAPLSLPVAAFTGGVD